MSRIKNKNEYAIKYNPIPSDYVIGSDSENNGKTVNFEMGVFSRDGVALQNNRFKLINFGTATQANSGSLPNVGERINLLPTNTSDPTYKTILEDQIPIFSGIVERFDGYVELKKYVCTKGMGTYGVGGNVVLQDVDLIEIESKPVLNDPIVDGEGNSEVVELGELPNGNYLFAINSLPPFTINTAVNWYFQYTVSGSRYLYGYKGESGTFGAGEQAMSNSDLFLIYNAENPVVESDQNLQDVTSKGNETILPIKANSFIKADGTNDDILLADGSTTKLSEIGGATPITQDNRILSFEFAVAEFTKEEIATRINQLPYFTITDIDIPFFTGTKATGENRGKVTAFIKNRGKAAYGVGGINILPSEVIIVATGGLTYSDISTAPSTQTIYLGNIGTNSIQDGFNNFNFGGVVIQDQSNGYVIVDAIMEGVLTSFLFTGAGGAYGINVASPKIASVQDFKISTKPSDVIGGLPAGGLTGQLIRKASSLDYDFEFFTDGGNLGNHLSDFNNPHQVTKSQVGLSDVDNTSDLAKPISTATGTALSGKQPNLVSGTNIKTINGESILGTGNIVVTSGGGTSNLTLGETVSTAYRGDRGKIAYDHSQAAHAPTNAQKNSDITKGEIEAKLTGAITTHTHDIAQVNNLATTLSGKQPNLVSGTNIKTINGESLMGSGNIVISGGGGGTSDLVLGETSTTAYRGDRGKIAYDHSLTTHAPANAQKNSDITKAEIEAKLTGIITTHTHEEESITGSVSSQTLSGSQNIDFLDKAHRNITMNGNLDITFTNLPPNSKSVTRTIRTYNSGAVRSLSITNTLSSYQIFNTNSGAYNLITITASTNASGVTILDVFFNTPN